MNLVRLQDTQKSLAFLYANNERSEREIKETIPFTIASKRIKYLGINLPKGAKDLYNKSPTYEPSSCKLSKMQTCVWIRSRKRSSAT